MPQEETLNCLQKALSAIDADGLSLASCYVQQAIDLVGEQQLRSLAAMRKGVAHQMRTPDVPDDHLGFPT